jgi:hypothetical protein
VLRIAQICRTEEIDNKALVEIVSRINDTSSGVHEVPRLRSVS